jgi:enamine deaminase RidA (YjgF/YER057c/UK114 family)
MLVSSVLSVVSQQIGATIRGHIRLQWDFNKDLIKMKMALESVQAVLKDAERQSIQDATVRLWLKRLKDAMYAISDMLDEFESGNKPARWKVRSCGIFVFIFMFWS